MVDRSIKFVVNRRVRSWRKCLTSLEAQNEGLCPDSLLCGLDYGRDVVQQASHQADKPIIKKAGKSSRGG